MIEYNSIEREIELLDSVKRRKARELWIKTLRKEFDQRKKNSENLFKGEKKFY
jgi:hypothetical protein